MTDHHIIFLELKSNTNVVRSSLTHPLPLPHPPPSECAPEVTLKRILQLTVGHSPELVRKHTVELTLGVLWDLL